MRYTKIKFNSILGSTLKKIELSFMTKSSNRIHSLKNMNMSLKFLTFVTTQYTNKLRITKKQVSFTLLLPFWSLFWSEHIKNYRINLKKKLKMKKNSRKEFTLRSLKRKIWLKVPSWWTQFWEGTWRRMMSASKISSRSGVWGMMFRKRSWMNTRLLWREICPRSR